MAGTLPSFSAHRPPDEQQHDGDDTKRLEIDDPHPAIVVERFRRQTSTRSPAGRVGVTIAATLIAAAGLPASPSAAANDTIELPALPGWASDAFDGLPTAIDRQCASKRPPPPWPALCAQRPAGPGSLRAWLESRFVARPMAGPPRGADGLLTGYHEPMLEGSRVREHAHQVPVFAPPADPARRTRSREEIEADARADDAWLWLDDPVEAFFLHIQGSGRIRLRDGSTIRIGYAADNTRTYRAIGRELVDRGHLPRDGVDATTIKQWLREHPREAVAVMRSNPRYIYFRELPPTVDGPVGALGVALTPGRSVATDPVHVIPGSLLWIDSIDPMSAGPLRRLVLSQDTGAAIRGPVRADLFWGSDEAAAQAAASTHHRLRAWRLEPREAR